MKRIVKMVIFLLVIALGLTLSSSALSNPPPQEPPPPGLQQAPMRPALPKPPPPRTGFIPPPIDLSHLTGQRMPEVFRLEVLPDSFDWRTQGKVTSVKDQGNCGSCYAFASIANFESKTLKDGAYTLPDPDFSENNAKECNWYETSGPLPIGSCDGGNYHMLANLFSKKGTVLESCDEYADSDVDCNSSCAYQKTLLDWGIISGNAVPDTDVLKTYIQTYGPVYTSLYASFPGFDLTYDGSYTFYYTGPGIPNHAVLIVGWDDSLAHDGGFGGWIVKNSWGTGWGGPCGYGTDGGYFTIAYGSASIGKYSSFLYNWQDYDNTGDIMYYDEGGMSNAWGCSPPSTTAWGLVKFIPSFDANVTRVEFWTTDITTDVDVYIYDDFDGTNPTNPLRSVENNSFEEAGYHSVVVDPPLAVTSGDDVIAVVKFTNSSEVYVVSDQYGPYQTNRTYISCTGSSGPWIEMGAGYGDDVAIRLRVSDIVTPTPTPTPTGYNVYLPLVLKNYSPPPPAPGTFYSVADACVLQGYATWNFGDTSDMWAGYDDYLDPDGKIARSLIYFDVSAIPPSTSIDSAALRVYLVTSYDFPGKTRTITFYRIASAWSESSVTWNTHPSYGEAHGSASVTHAAWGWYSFDVTNLVRGWVNGTIPNNGVMLRGPEWSGYDSSWRGFSTREGPYTPQLVITYSGYTSGEAQIGAESLQPEEPRRGIIETVTGLPKSRLPSADLCQKEPPAGRKCLALQ